MTKYILHGGATNTPSVNNDNFFKEMIRGLNSPIKILLIYYATIEARWDDRYKDDQNKFNKIKDDKKLEFMMATNDLNLLKKQIKDADVIYMRGGSQTSVLVDTLSKIENFAVLIKDKVVSGSSAGAYAIGKYYFSHRQNFLGRGLGLLPIKCLAHYDLEEYKKHLNDLEKMGENLEIYKIPETEFFVIEK